MGLQCPSIMLTHDGRCMWKENETPRYLIHHIIVAGSAAVDGLLDNSDVVRCVA